MNSYSIPGTFLSALLELNKSSQLPYIVGTTMSPRYRWDIEARELYFSNLPKETKQVNREREAGDRDSDLTAKHCQASEDRGHETKAKTSPNILFSFSLFFYDKKGKKSQFIYWYKQYVLEKLFIFI